MKIRLAEFILLIIAIVCALVFLGDKGVKLIATNLGARNDSHSVLTADAAGAGVGAESYVFDHINIGAKAAYVYDVDSGQVIYAQNENETLPLASLTKIMTAVVASSILSPTTTITINKEALNEDGDNGLLLGEQWDFKDLLDFTLTVSSNDGAHAIAAAAGAVINQTQNTDANDASNIATFVSLMNAKAQALGLTSMTFENSTGLDQSTTDSGEFASAKDMTALFAYVLKNYPDLLQSTTHDHIIVKSLSGVEHDQPNSDEVVDKLPGLFASKTGYTDLAGGNLTVAIDVGINHPVIMCLLGSTFDGRFSDMQTLASSTIAYYQ